MKHITLRLLGTLLFGSLLFATVQVSLGLPKIVFFGASSRTIHQGEAVTLTWEVKGVDTVTLEWAPENALGHPQRRAGLRAMGALAMLPKETTVFVLSCDAGLGPLCEPATLTVEVK